MTTTLEFLFPTTISSSIVTRWVAGQTWTTYAHDHICNPFLKTNIIQDEERLPEGMQRIGYDADTQQYTFRAQDGTIYESAPGNRYGELTPEDYIPDSEETQQRDKAVEKGNRDAVRTMLPFALLVLVFMFLLFKVINGGGASTSSGSKWADDEGKQVPDCGEGSRQIQVQKGDTCWGIAEEYRLGIDELLERDGNEHVNCDNLRIWQRICVPA